MILCRMCLVPSPVIAVTCAMLLLLRQARVYAW